MCKNDNCNNTKSQYRQRCWLFGLAFLGAACLCMAVILCKRYCVTRPSPDLTAKVVKNIREGLDVPDSFKLIAAEKPDSAFGVYWFPMEEQEAISEKAMDFSMTMLDHVGDMYAEDSMDEHTLTQIKFYGPLLQKAGLVMTELKEKGDFSGWKIKVIYQFSDAVGNTFTLTRWTFLDPKGEKILGKLEIPGEVVVTKDEELLD